jgi:hypothetical protein
VFGRRAHIDLMWLGDELHIMNIEIINKSNNHWLKYKLMKNDGGPWFHRREGSKGEVFMGVNPTHIYYLCV